jgi:fermentation-respiration switch protein FrsA (DUF1100 family)
VQDGRGHWTAGLPLYDPAAITCPVMLLTAEWDDNVRLETTRGPFKRLAGTVHKRFVEIGQGTHIVLVEHQRAQAFGAVIAFLDDEVSGGL